MLHRRALTLAINGLCEAQRSTNPVHGIVHARHGRELKGVKVPCARTHGKHICSMLPEVQANGKGDSARSGLKEAGGQMCGPMDENRITRMRVPEA